MACLINPGWSWGLGLDEAPELAAADPHRDRDRASKITVCGFLVDVYSLGVKDVVPPKTMGVDRLNEYAERYYSAFEHPPVPIELSHAQDIVAGAVAYARDLGFEPHQDFSTTDPFLGTPQADPPPIGFGRDGMPLYINGPRDNAPAIVTTLRQRRGDGNFHYVVADGPMWQRAEPQGPRGPGHGRVARRRAITDGPYLRWNW